MLIAGDDRPTRGGAEIVPQALAKFFRDVKDQNQKTAEQAKQLLGKRLG